MKPFIQSCRYLYKNRKKKQNPKKTKKKTNILSCLWASKFFDMLEKWMIVCKKLKLGNLKKNQFVMFEDIYYSPSQLLPT